MATTGKFITSNVDIWKKAGFAAAQYLSSADAVNAIGAVMRDRMRRILREQFRSQGSFGASGRWRELTPEYREWKAIRYPGQPILVATGALRASWTTAQNNVATAQRVSQGILFRFGSLDEKAEWHQKGVPINNLPARRQLDMKEQQLRGAALAVARTMEEGLFSRQFFDARQRRYFGLAIKYTGWEQIELP